MAADPPDLPGSIQPHGCLLACDSHARQIVRASANAADMLGHPGAAAGAELVDVLGSQALHDLRNAITTAAAGRPPGTLLGLALANGRRFDVAVHRDADAVIAEFEPAGHGPDPLQRARALIGRISGIDDADALVARAARLAHGVLGYDRVMVCRFERDGDGKVVAEVRRPDLESFLGEHFPARDFPAQARALHLRTALRVIADADGAGVPIVPELDDAGQPLDLARAHLRGVSPGLGAYLRSMGAAAALSIPVIVDGRLWGLIAGHHHAPRVLSMAERTVAELFGQFLSLRLHALEAKRSAEAAAEARRVLDGFLHRAGETQDIEALLRESLPDFARLLPCDGVGLWRGGVWSAHGITPRADAVPALARFVSEVSDGTVWASGALAQAYPPVGAFHEEVSGLLTVPLSRPARDHLFFFRREVVRTLNRGGGRKESVEREAEPWTDADLDIAEATRAVAAGIGLLRRPTGGAAQ